LAVSESAGQAVVLQVGARLGHYELLAALGSGGMGEVYRARDLKLDREVALKRLPELVRADRGRLDHFVKEARAAARLSHPNVMAIFELAEAEGETFIVTELLEGRTLRDRLAAGALPWRKAVEYAIQICAGLGAAHERGIIHCDLKPDNVFITIEDRIKILDFGLARLAEGAGLVGLPPTTVTLHSSATLRGTFGYMAPEQVRGAVCDPRADLFALGAVLYEMLAGSRAFGGHTPAESLGAILKDDPPPLPGSVPTVVARIVSRCLEKEPAARFHSAHDLGLALEAASTSTGTATGGLLVLPAIARRTWLLAAVAFVATGALALAYLAGSGIGRVAQRPTPVRFSIELPPSTGLVEFTAAPLALAADGQSLILALTDEEGGSRLWRRRFDTEALEPITGTEGATSPFVSPDGQSIAFAAQGKLRRVSLGGGLAQDIADAQQFFGGCWVDSETIVYAPRFAGGLWQVAATGGKPARLTAPSGGEDSAHVWPTCLSGSRNILYTTWGSGKQIDRSKVAYLRLGDGAHGTLIRGGYHPRYLEPDTLLFVRGGALMSVAFDPSTLEVSGVPEQRVGGLLANVNSLVAFYETSNGSHLVYVQGTHEQPNRRLVWVDLQGRVEPASALRKPFSLPRISPDGSRVATWLQDEGVAVWLLDLRGDRLTRLSGGIDDHSPVWSPDGTRVAFDSSRTGNYELYLASANTMAEETAITNRRRDHFVNAWLPDGRLVFTDHSIVEGFDLWTIDARPGAEAEPLLRTTFNESEPAFSADGRWIAYVTDETRRNEVYVRRFPLEGPRLQASRNGGEEPVWSRSGHELFFRKGRDVLAVRLESGEDGPRLTEPEVLFGGRYHYNLYPTNTYDVAPDGRFLMVEEPPPVTRTIHVVLSFGAAMSP
jgi:Tol biopolymer transport system component